MYTAYASFVDIKLVAVTVDVKGHMDLKGLFGMDEFIPAGYTRIEYVTNIPGQEPNSRIVQLLQTAESHCPVLDTLNRPVQVTGTGMRNNKELSSPEVI